eukprot:gene23992-32400_t
MINEVDLRSLWSELDNYSVALEKEKADLAEVWIKIAQIKSQNESDIRELDKKPEFQFLDPDTLVSINVGGQIFEASVEILTKDPYSMLAGLCRNESPIVKPDEDGIFYIDRDWWIFRHILSFLRSNILPNELETLKELYLESSFYRLEKLQRAIENIPVDQVSNLSPHIAVTWSGVREKDPLASIDRVSYSTRNFNLGDNNTDMYNASSAQSGRGRPDRSDTNFRSSNNSSSRKFNNPHGYSFGVDYDESHVQDLPSPMRTPYTNVTTSIYSESLFPGLNGGETLNYTSIPS